MSRLFAAGSHQLDALGKVSRVALVSESRAWRFRVHPSAVCWFGQPESLFISARANRQDWVTSRIAAGRDGLRRRPRRAVVALGGGAVTDAGIRGLIYLRGVVWEPPDAPSAIPAWAVRPPQSAARQESGGTFRVRPGLSSAILWLKTLPERERRSGLAGTKYGLVFDPRSESLTPLTI